jgi:hypothetical protein
MNLEFSGNVTAYVDKSGVKKSDNTPFKAWLVVVEETGVGHPNSMVAEYYGEKVAIPEIGSMVKVYYNLRASEYNGNWYGKNNIWRIDLIEAAQSAQPQAAQQSAPEVADPSSALPF